MSGPLLQPFKAQNPAGVRIWECFLLDAEEAWSSVCCLRDQALLLVCPAVLCAGNV